MSDKLRAVAAFVTVGTWTYQKPAFRAVAAHFGTTERGAQQLIYRARQEGFLLPSTKPPGDRIAGRQRAADRREVARLLRAHVERRNAPSWFALGPAPDDLLLRAAELLSPKLPIDNDNTEAHTEHMSERNPS